MNDSPKLARPTMSLDLSETEDERGEVGSQMVDINCITYSGTLHIMGNC